MFGFHQREAAANPESESAVVGLWAGRDLEQPPSLGNGAARLSLRVAVSKKPLEIRTLSSFSSLEEFRSVWASWPGSLSSDIDYYLVTLRDRGSACEPHVVVVIRNGEPEAMLVGLREKQIVRAKVGRRTISKAVANVLEFVPGSLRGISSDENCDALIREVQHSLKRGDADVAFWDDLEVQSPLYRHALSLPHSLLADHCNWRVDRWLMKFPNSLEDFLMSLERSQRSKLRRKYKKVLTHFDQRLQLRMVSSVADLQSIIPHVEEIAAKTEKRKLGFGFFDTPETREELVQAAEKGWLRGFVIYLDGEPAAFWIGSLYNRCLKADYVGYDPAWAEFSPGIFLFLSVINILHREDIETIDFGRGDTQLRQCFSDVKRVEARVRIYAPTIRGLWLNLVRTAGFKATVFLRANRRDAEADSESQPSSELRAEGYFLSSELEHV